MKLYNTLSRKVEEFIPYHKDKVTYIIFKKRFWDGTNLHRNRSEKFLCLRGVCAARAGSFEYQSGGGG